MKRDGKKGTRALIFNLKNKTILKSKHSTPALTSAIDFNFCPKSKRSELTPLLTNFLFIAGIFVAIFLVVIIGYNISKIQSKIVDEIGLTIDKSSVKLEGKTLFIDLEGAENIKEIEQVKFLLYYGDTSKEVILNATDLKKTGAQSYSILFKNLELLDLKTISISPGIKVKGVIKFLGVSDRITISKTGEIKSESFVCGNNILEMGEQCDDGNKANGDGCSSTCQTEKLVKGVGSCGDNYVNSSLGETCDPPTSACSPSYRKNCTYCGNNCTYIKVIGGYCGDNSCNGNENYSTCSTDCSSTCGDGYCVSGENCSSCLNDCACISGKCCLNGVCNNVGTCSETTICSNGSWISSCGDGACNCGETSINCLADCKKPIGEACTSGVNCTSKNCVDNVCCFTSLCADCKSCNIAGYLGACSNDPVGTSCTGGICDGSGQCIFPREPYYMFVTTLIYTGKLGGIAGANTICNSDSNKPVSGTYKAFISINGNYPSAASLGINIASMINSFHTGLKIANNYADLIDENGISTNRISPDDTRIVWTGARDEINCLGWTSSLSSYGAGSGYANGLGISYWWHHYEYCNQEHPLYCIGPI